MVQAFINGGVPDCPGEVHLTAVSALTAIRDKMVAAGWEVASGSPTSLPLVMRGMPAINGVNPYMRFSIPAATTIRLNGDWDGSGSSLSTGRDWTLVDGQGNLVWAGFDENAGVVWIRPPTSNGIVHHFGRRQLVNPNDAWAWSVGEVSSAYVSYICQDAQVWNGTAKWPSNFAYGGVFSNLLTGYSNSLSGLSGPAQNDANQGYPELGPYSRNTHAGFRGVIKFVVTGMAGLQVGDVFTLTDQLGTRRFIATPSCGIQVAAS